MEGRVMLFQDRRDAGRRLAKELGQFRQLSPVVVALPRGGVPIGDEVARELDASLDVLVVRKLGHPLQPELGLGAIGEDGVRVLNPSLVGATGVTEEDIAVVERRESRALEQRIGRYRGQLPAVPLDGRVVIMVDDGVATGSTARTGVEVLRLRGAARVVVAVPVASESAILDLRRLADEVVCLHTPASLRSIGQWYADFSQVSDDEVADLLEASRPDGRTTQD